jgi:peptidoglycan-associated lipoprotein
MSKKMLNSLLVAIIASTVAACSSTQAPEPVVASAPVPEVASEPVVSVASEPVVASAPAVMSHNAVYFAFNKYDVKDGYTGVVQTNANYLASNAQAHVQIQGNTDDIGSVEYNLALGQRRADAVKKALIANGVSRKQIEAVSYGKLKPKYPNDNDSGRAQNRRSDIVYKAGQPQGYSVDSSTNELPMVDGSFYNGTVVEGVQ